MGCRVVFQSSPTLSGRCNSPAGRQCRTRSRFNPHRPSRAGATQHCQRAMALPECFNPHRPSRAGATSDARHGARMPVQFQSSPTLSGRCNTRSRRRFRRGKRFQSSPTLSGRCNDVLAAAGVEGAWFQSSPTLSGRCNRIRCVLCSDTKRFQSSPTLSGRCNGNKFPFCRCLRPLSAYFMADSSVHSYANRSSSTCNRWKMSDKRAETPPKHTHAARTPWRWRHHWGPRDHTIRGSCRSKSGTLPITCRYLSRGSCRR